MNSTTTIVCETPTLPTTLEVEEGEKKNASESAEPEASSVAFATLESTTEYNTEPPACQIAAAPTLEEIETEIAVAARKRIEAALRELNETRARIERERAARDTALKAAQERVTKLQTELGGLEGERAAMENRAQTFLTADALKAAMGNMHLGFNVRQIELEDALAIAQADAQEMQTEIQAAAVSDALELQLAEQYLEQLETAVPEVAEIVRLAASAEENVAAAIQAVKDDFLRDAEVLLEKAKAGNADPTKITQVEQMLADAKRETTARDLIARINAIAAQPGAVRRIKKLIAEAETIGLADKIASSARRALRTAREGANARFAQAQPIADHLAGEGFVPVVGDGRIEVWKEISKNGHGSTWTLDRVMVLNKNVWDTKSPRMPVTRKELPNRVLHSRWFNRPSTEPSAPSN